MVIKYRSNLCVGIFGIIVGIAVWFVIPLQIAEDYTKSYGITSRTLPYGVALLILICGFCLVFQSLVLKKDTTKEIYLNLEAKAVAYMIVLIIYTVIFKFSFIASLVFLGTATLLFMKSRKPLFYITVSVAAILLFVAFKYVLHARIR
jgi:hypothetical protein